MHVCGCYFLVAPPPTQPWSQPTRRYLPLVSLRSQTAIVASTARTTLAQTFVNTQQDKTIEELRYTFPLYDGVSVVGFVCTINKDRVIRGCAKEKDAARRAYKQAVDRGETAGLLEQLPDASDVFTTTIGNIPAGAEVRVDITYLGELKHDAEADGIRFTIPTSIAPRYGSGGCPGELLSRPSNVSAATAGIEVVVDVEIPAGGQGNHIKTVKSPSHPISVEMRQASNGGISAAKAEISISSLELEKDVVVVVVPAKPDTPVAVLENHPTIPGQRALMATFVPRFNLPQSRPEIVFVCDRSGSMGTGRRIPNLKAALQIFLRSLPVGVKFNIVSFGSSYSFLFDRSRSYDQSSLDEASRHVDRFDDSFGGTEMHNPIDEVFRRRYADMDLEVFVLTDGEIWDQSRLFEMVNNNIAKCQGAARLFTLGIGDDVSHSLVEGLARAGRGFAQVVGDQEKLNAKVVRMLKASLSPHIDDYSLEIQYGGGADKGLAGKSANDDFEMVEAEDADGAITIEKVMDALVLDVPEEKRKEGQQSQPPAKSLVSLFSPTADPDEDVNEQATSAIEPKYAHVPPVPTPKLLQAPFEIPPMYNFTRTSIYVLLDPASSHRSPKAVVLRGTTPSHGPVELSIPVQVLVQPGETVHQLAAKKAVQDLEEGRGWLAHAKDAADGKLLKEKHQGRFGDMVEREAVRLGVTFQVGGKWCSFVAIDDDTAKEQVTAEAQQEPSPVFPTRGGPVRMMMARRTAATAPMQKRSAQASAMPATASLFGASSSPFRASGQKAMRSTAMAFSAAPPPPGPRVGGLNAMPSAAMAFSAAPPPPPAPGGLFGAAPPAPASMFKAKKSAPVHPDAEESKEEDDALEESDEDMGFGLYSDTMSISASAGPQEACLSVPAEMEASSQDSVTSEPLPALVRLQAFEGFWDWSPSLYTALGLAQEAVTKELSDDLARGKIGATACAIAFLRKKLSESADEWEMLVDKAISWLESQGVAVEALLGRAESLF